MHSDYNRTIRACFVSSFIQAIVINFMPLLFVTFHTTYGISLAKITLLTLSLIHISGDVGREDHVFQAQQRVVGGNGLHGGHVQTGGRDLAGQERCEMCIRDRASTSPKALNSTHLPSMTGMPASGPMSPRPSTCLLYTSRCV